MDQIELKQIIMERRDEEEHDVEVYKQLSEQVHDRHIAGILEDIMYDEETHAHALCHILKLLDH